MKLKYTSEYLKPFVEASTSWMGLIKSLGVKPTGGMYNLIQTRVNQHKLDTSHFTGQGWARGLTAETNEIVKRISEKNTWSDDRVFAYASGCQRANLRKRMLASKEWDNKCAICGLTEWLGNHIVLHIDHIDGCAWNNIKENLRFLCPNCHSQTPTYGNGTKHFRQPVNKCIIKKHKIAKKDNKKMICMTDGCGVIIGTKGKHGYCVKCTQLNSRLVNRPSLEELRSDILNSSMTQIGKKYGVSDNAIRKWLSQYGLPRKLCDIMKLRSVVNADMGELVDPSDRESDKH